MPHSPGYTKFQGIFVLPSDLNFRLNLILTFFYWMCLGYMPFLVIYFATVLATGEFYIELILHIFFKANILKSFFKSTNYYSPPDLLTYSNILYWIEKKNEILKYSSMKRHLKFMYCHRQHLIALVEWGRSLCNWKGRDII